MRLLRDNTQLVNLPTLALEIHGTITQSQYGPLVELGGLQSRKPSYLRIK